MSFHSDSFILIIFQSPPHIYIFHIQIGKSSQLGFGLRLFPSIFMEPILCSLLKVKATYYHFEKCINSFMQLQNGCKRWQEGLGKHRKVKCECYLKGVPFRFLHTEMANSSFSKSASHLHISCSNCDFHIYILQIQIGMSQPGFGLRLFPSIFIDPILLPFGQTIMNEVCNGRKI